MNILNKIRAHFARAVLPQLGPEETLLFNNFRDHPEMWSCRRMTPGIIKCDHRTSGMWVLLRTSGDCTTSEHAAHVFSLPFTTAFRAIANKRVLESEAKERQAVTVAVFNAITEAFDGEM